MPKIKKKAFFYPSQPANTSSESPLDQAAKDINDTNKKNNMLINLTEGKHNTIESFDTYIGINGVQHHSEKTSYYNYSDLNTDDVSYYSYKSLYRPGNNSL